MEPFSASAVFASIGSAFKFADLAVRIAEVGSENEVFVRTIHVVREDLNEVNRLLSTESIQRKLASIPGKLPWIKGAVTNTKTALNDIGQAVERARAEKQATGSIRFETRVRWVFNDHEKIINRTSELSICHQQLSNVLGYLIRLEDVPDRVEPPAYQDITYFDDVVTRHRGRGALASPEHRMLSQRLLNPVEPPKNMKPECNVGIGVDIEHMSVLHNPQQTASADVPFSRQEYMRTSSYSVSSQTISTPCSPAPTYTSVAQVDSMVSHHSFGHDQWTGLEALDLEAGDPTSQVDTTPTCYSSKLQLPPSKTEEMKERARWYSQSEFSSPELEGDILCLTATNLQGPVNPFEFDPDPQPLLVPIVPKLEDTKRLFELPGNPLVPVEPPTINDRLPLVCLSKEEHDLTYGTKRSTAIGGYIGSTHAGTISKSTIVPARTRVFTNAAMDCTIPCNELSSESPALDVNDQDLKEKATSNAPKHGTSTLGLASWSNTPPKTPCPLPHGPNDTSNTLNPSVPPPKTVTQCHLQFCSPEQSGQFLSLSQSVANLNQQSQYSKPQDPAIITRMRSQKQMIALLESIET
ncbi:hypothetical protein BU25DRAFT_415829 [Macroventuria anomochaeta]|uniref:Uncharacterized protein n=1 Tax=Macroventuria anomochaeta TaxID=301207 RepID=A0ACB6RIT3_9PLEO|nr:uncharacterized protein BU25DRAFT_415829 [Macroventuria anomochaeta]KAF2621825.1 hypothetical protein BU25DRAFT_415829 [Macroventuria anomochaeta]